MTIEEARIFLGIRDINDDLREAFIVRLFESKQAFLTQTIVRSVYESKIRKIEHIRDAAICLGLEVRTSLSKSNYSFQNPTKILDLFNEFEQIKNTIRLRIHHAEFFQELIYAVSELLDVHSNYCTFWINTNIDPTTILLSKEADPMQLISELKRLQTLGIETFEQFEHHIKNADDSIKMESMRLYLLSQREQNG